MTMIPVTVKYVVYTYQYDNTLILIGDMKGAHEHMVPTHGLSFVQGVQKNFIDFLHT